MSVLVGLALGLAGVACSSTKPPEHGGVEFEAHRPTYIRALGASNRTAAVEATEIVDECVESTLEERGYRGGDRTRSATLHVAIETWGRFEGEPHVRVSGELFDDASGALIWSGAAEDGGQASFEDTEESSWLEGVLASCLDAAVDALISSQERSGRTAVESMFRTLPKAKPPRGSGSRN